MTIKEFKEAFGGELRVDSFIKIENDNPAIKLCLKWFSPKSKRKSIVCHTYNLDNDIMISLSDLLERLVAQILKDPISMTEVLADLRKNSTTHWIKYDAVGSVIAFDPCDSITYSTTTCINGNNH